MIPDASSRPPTLARDSWLTAFRAWWRPALDEHARSRSKRKVLNEAAERACRPVTAAEPDRRLGQEPGALGAEDHHAQHVHRDGAGPDAGGDVHSVVKRAMRAVRNAPPLARRTCCHPLPVRGNARSARSSLDDREILPRNEHPRADHSGHDTRRRQKGTGQARLRKSRRSTRRGPLFEWSGIRRFGSERELVDPTPKEQ